MRACASASRLVAKKEYMVEDTSYIYYSYIAQSYHMSISRSSLAQLTREDGRENVCYFHGRRSSIKYICTASDWSDSSRVVDSVDLFQIKKATTASNPFAAEGAKRWRALAHPSSTHSTVGSFEIRIEGGSFVWMTRREDDDDDDDDLNRIKQKSSKKRLPSEEWRGVRGVRPRPRPSQLRVPPVENQISISRQDLANLTHALKSNWLEWRFSVGCVYRMEIESFHI